MGMFRIAAGATALIIGALAGSGAVANETTTDAVTLAALQERIAQLERQVQRHDDYIAIVNLQRAYGFYVDKAQWDQAADLFSRDATLEISQRGLFRGQDRIRAYMKQLPDLKEGRLFNHMQLQPVINIAEDGKTAKGRWRAVVEAAVLGEWAQLGEGIYENEYVKEDGVWKISKLHWFVTYYIPFDQGWDKGGIPLMTEERNKIKADAGPTVRYEGYPSVYIPPYHYRNPVSGREFEPQPPMLYQPGKE